MCNRIFVYSHQANVNAKAAHPQNVIFAPDTQIGINTVFWFAQLNISSFMSQIISFNFTDSLLIIVKSTKCVTFGDNFLPIHTIHQ